MLLSPAGRRVTGWFERPCHRHTSAATPPAIGDGAIGAGDEFEQACRPLLGLSPRATKYLGFKIKVGQTECRITHEVDAELTGAATMAPIIGSNRSPVGAICLSRWAKQWQSRIEGEDVLARTAGSHG